MKIFLESRRFNEDIFKGMDEVKLTRYIHDLADKDYLLVNGMIPLGSRTMKLNPTLGTYNDLEYNMDIRFLLRNISRLQVTDFKNWELFKRNNWIQSLFFSTHFAAGEYSGLCIKKYHETRGSDRIFALYRNRHGTNFAMLH